MRKIISNFNCALELKKVIKNKSINDSEGLIFKNIEFEIPA